MIPNFAISLGRKRGISRNTQYYEEPSKFNPERFLKQTPELDPRQFVFGFGRRICPGNELAFQAVWITAASILWGVKLQKSGEDIIAPDQDLDRFSLGSVRYECFYNNLKWNAHNSFRGFKCTGVLQVPSYPKAPEPKGYVRSPRVFALAKLEERALPRWRTS